jgi:transposase
MAQGGVKRRGSGRPQQRPPRRVGDKAYSRRAIRQYLRTHGIRITIPRQRGEGRPGPFNRAIYRWRSQVERFMNRLKQRRRSAPRHEKRAANDHAMLLIAAIVLWL